MGKVKKIIITIILAILYIILQPIYANAALQSNGGAPATKNINGWITGVRQMQASGGTLGLTDTINGTNLTSGNKNLDIHMEKNTEYGAMVILSASSYGNPNKIEDGGTTTGNATGVVMKINKEWVSAGVVNTEATSMKNASARYKNVYPTPAKDSIGYQEKVGDAIATVGAWHGSTSTTWISCIENDYYNNASPFINRSCLLRSYSGSIFSYYGYGYTNRTTGSGNNTDLESCRRDAHYLKSWATRAVVVVGAGV